MRPLWQFLLFYTFIGNVFGDDCSGTLEIQASKTPKFITTPNYSNSLSDNSTYPPFLDCRFVIKAPDKNRILIEIINLKMETKLFSSCVDYVGIYEDLPDNNNTESLLAQFCEEVTNRQVISNLNRVVIVFKSDDLYQYGGANISVQSIEYQDCPSGWHNFKNTTCIKLSDEKVDWITAQNRCLQQKSNLLMIENSDIYSFIYNHFSHVLTNIWIGYHDGTTETRIDGIDGISGEPNGSTSNSFQLSDNNDENDCMALDFGNNIHYKMDKCSNNHMYICYMEKDWNTTLYPVPENDLREGLYSKASQYSLWILLFVIGLLFLTILAFLCFLCWKQKDSNRIHDESATIQQNAFMNDTNQTSAQPPAAQPAQTRVSPSPQAQQIQQPTQGSMPNSSRVIEKVPMIRSADKNKKQFPVAVGPRRVPMSEEPSGETAGIEGETNIMHSRAVGNDSEEHLVPATKPRTLPPLMPPREGTFQSINTKDGSTMQTRRNRERFDRPVMNVLDNVSAISLDEFWSNKKP